MNSKNPVKHTSNIPWYSIQKTTINNHMMSHFPYDKESGFVWFDLELSYLLGHTTKDFQAICENRIIAGMNLDMKPRKVRWLADIQIDKKLEDINNLSYAWQNLVYMYALWLVDVLDIDIVSQVYNPNIDNTDRIDKWFYALDWISPIFDNIIWIKDEIRAENVSDVRAEYIKKRPLADKIKYQWKYFQLKLNDIALLRKDQQAMAI